MPIQIREAMEKEKYTLTNIIRESFYDVAKQFNLTIENAPSHPSNCTEDWIKSALEKGIKYYILDVDMIPCGCVALEQASYNICYMERLSILPKFRKKGLGSLLTKFALNEARKMGFKRIEIGIIANNYELKKWYAKLGFIEKSTQKLPHLPFMVSFMYLEI